MALKFQKEIDSIENCPVDNLLGEITLFRCVEHPMTEKSFVPYAVLQKPKLKGNCLAWGLSMFKTYDSAKQMLNNLSQNKRENYSNVAKGIITDNDGIKHNSKKTTNHYTFYPEEGLDIVSKFAIVDSNENK